MAENWIKIERNSELHQGDIVELDFTLLSLFDWTMWSAMQLAAIEYRFEADPRFTLLSHTYPEQNVVTFKIKVNKNPVMVSTLIALILIGGIIFISFEGGRKLVREMAAAGQEIGWSTIQIAAAALAVIVGLVILRKAK